MNWIWIYLLAAIALFAAPLQSALPSVDGITTSIETIRLQTGVPNLVSGVILQTRLFDTVAEVVVFTLAASGVRLVLSGEPERLRVRGMVDAPSRVLCEVGSTVAALIAVELALRGHLSPGGGFAAGVAGGTAIGLLLISGGAERYEEIYLRWRADWLEKVAVVMFILIAAASLAGLELPQGRFGALFSGGWIPLLNALVAIKVTLGSWAMIQRLVRHRGLL